MNKKDSTHCVGCGKEFELALVAMVRRRPMWCDGCIALADEKLLGVIRRAQEGLAEKGEGVGRG